MSIEKIPLWHLRRALAFYADSPDGQYDYDVVMPILQAEIERRAILASGDLIVQTTPQKLRKLSATATDSLTAKALLDAAEHHERLDGWCEALQRLIEAEGYEILNSVDGKEVRIRLKGWRG